MNLWKVTYRHYFRHPWQVIFSIIGVSLGVAVVIAIDLANSSAKKAFELSSAALTGRATHQIVGGPRGLPEEFYVDLRLKHDVDLIAPVLEGYGDIIRDNNDNRSFHILGVDILVESSFRGYLNNSDTDYDITQFLTTPNTAVMLQSAAWKVGLALASEFTLQVRGIRHTFTLIGLIKSKDPLVQQALESIVFVDIATAQEVLDMSGRLSQIDLILTDDKAGQTRRALIENVLPKNAEIISSDTRAKVLANMTSAFQLNLKALSLLALLVGLFLIYNTMTFSVVQRRNTLGYLRILGVTRKQIFKLIFTEALIIGVIATLIGFGLGILLGKGLLHYVTRTINDLYFLLSVNDLYVEPRSIIKGILVGVIATAVAVIKPAMAATRSTPRVSLSRSREESSYKSEINYLAVFGVFMGGIGVSMFTIPGNSLMLSFTGLFLIIMGFAFLVPILSLILIRFVTPILEITLGQLGKISARSISTSFSHIGVAITTLTIAVATTIGVAIMIDSFRSTVIDWLDSTLSADVYVSSAGVGSHAGGGDLSPKWLAIFREITDVETIGVIRNVRLRSAKGLTDLNVMKVPFARLSSLKFIDGDISNIRRIFNKNNVVLISEAYAFRNNFEIGDMLSLATDKGKRRFKVIGIYVDYGSEQGIVSISRPTYLKYWDDKNITSFEIYAKPGVNVAELTDLIKATVAKELASTAAAATEQNLSIRSNKALREASIKIFDRTFDVTQVLRLMAIIVAFVGILSALMAIQIERSRELAVLRTIGVTPKQIWLIISGETGLIGVLVGVLALPLGLVLATVLTLIINRRSFGWTMDLNVDPIMLAQTVVVVIITALLAGIIPAYRMSRIPPAIALREE